MRLIVDTSVLVGELLRSSGRRRLGDDRLELFLPEEMWDETRVELPRRVAAFARRRDLGSALATNLAAECLTAVQTNISVLPIGVYAAYEDEARARCVRDENDWPVVATALVLDAGVWTHDNDFLGTGVPTWITESLQGWLDRHPAES